MELQIGMYVRTKKGIGKIKSIEEDRSEIHFNCDSGMSLGFVKRGFTKEEMANLFKHSFNGLDVIEVGDFVNGKRVVKKWTEPFGEFAGQTFIKLDGEVSVPTYRAIETILTKEQYESMAYKVGGAYEN